MTVTKWHRTNGGRIADPMETDGEIYRPSTKEKTKRIKDERKAVEDVPIRLSMTLNFYLTTQSSAGHYLMNQLERQIMTDLLTKYNNNVELVANCLNTSRRTVWHKIREYGIEVGNA